MTPPELFRYPDEPGLPWQVRVVPNRYPFLSSDAGAGAVGDGLFMALPGKGHHEVVIESPRHESRPSDLRPEELVAVFRAYQRRLEVLRRDPAVKQAFIFKNYGVDAGTSLAHPHSQIVALPIIPPSTQRKLDAAKRHRARTGRSLYPDILQSEERAGTRLVANTPWFLAFHPFASRFPYETWIMPRTLRASFDEASGSEVEDLAELVHKVLVGFREKIGEPAFNYVIDGAPIDAIDDLDFVWHMRIVPRLTIAGGLELGSGIYANPIAPEDSAVLMRL